MQLLIFITFISLIATAYWDNGPWPAFVPLQEVMPGGKGQAYLSDKTEEFGDIMEARISHLSHQVSSMGHVVQNMATYGSDLVDHMSHIVDDDDPIYDYPRYLYPQDDEEEDQDDDHK